MKQLDAVQQIVQIVERVAPLAAEARAAVDAAIRAELGGEKVRIDARPPVTIEDINAGLYQRQPVREIARQLGVSRATIYRRLAERGSRTPAGR